MTHDPFAPPTGPPEPVRPTAPVAPSLAEPTAAGSAEPHYTYGTPLYTLPLLRSAAGLGVAAVVLACAWTASQVLRLALAPGGAQALRAAEAAGLAALDSPLSGYDAVSLPSVLLMFAAYIVTCLWLSRSRSTAVAANPPFIHERSPVWAWLGWWVPVVSFWFPYQVVRDVRRATAPGPVSGVGIGGWWAAWLVHLGASNLAGRLTVSGASGSAGQAADVLVPLEVVSTVAMVVALALWIRIVREITRAQEVRIAAA